MTTIKNQLITFPWFHYQLPYQYFLWRFGDGWKNVHTLCREVSLFLGADALTDTPARVHHRLPVLLIQDNQISLVEGQEGGAFSYREEASCQTTETECQYCAFSLFNPLPTCSFTKIYCKLLLGSTIFVIYHNDW